MYECFLYESGFSVFNSCISKSLCLYANVACWANCVESVSIISATRWDCRSTGQENFLEIWESTLTTTLLSSIYLFYYYSDFQNLSHQTRTTTQLKFFTKVCGKTFCWFSLASVCFPLLRWQNLLLSGSARPPAAAHQSLLFPAELAGSTTAAVTRRGAYITLLTPPLHLQTKIITAT